MTRASLTTRQAMGIVEVLFPLLRGRLRLTPWFDEDAPAPEPCVIRVAFGVSEPLAVGSDWVEAIEALQQRPRAELELAVEASDAWLRWRATEFSREARR